MENKQNAPALPAEAYFSLNRCNLPAVILGGLAFQQHPVSLAIDGVTSLHKQLFEALEGIKEPEVRAIHFSDYMRSSFLLDSHAEAGHNPEQKIQRHKADYLRLLRGWLFNPDGIEAAVLKHWVESRFGLIPRHHKGAITSIRSAAYETCQQDAIRGLYNTNGLQAQLDLLFSYCQHELQRNPPEPPRLSLYRGVNNLEKQKLAGIRAGTCLLFNNLNSFTACPELADSFGDQVLKVHVPRAKIVYFPGLLPGVLQGESEYLVLGGVYRVEKHR